EIETDRNTRVHPLAERRPDLIEENGLEVRGVRRGKPHTDRQLYSVVPTAQHRVVARRQHVAQICTRPSQANAAPCFRPGEKIEVRRLPSRWNGWTRGARR